MLALLGSTLRTGWFEWREVTCVMLFCQLDAGARLVLQYGVGQHELQHTGRLSILHEPPSAAVGRHHAKSARKNRPDQAPTCGFVCGL